VSCACGCRQGNGGIVVVGLRTICTTTDAGWAAGDRARTRASLADGQGELHTLVDPIFKVDVLNRIIIRVFCQEPV